MKATEDPTRTAMRAYAEAMQPPPVEVIFDRASRNEASTEPSPQPRAPRSRRRRVVALAVSGTLAVAAVTATAFFSVPQLTGMLTTPSTGAGSLRLAPLCGPGLPILNSDVQARHGGRDPGSGRLRKPITVQAGQTITLDAHLPAAPADRGLRTITLYLVPTGLDTVGWRVATGAAIRPTPGQHNVRMTLAVPSTVPAATYDLLEIDTWPAPSVCGQPNTDTHGQTGTTWATIASVTVTPEVH